MKSVIEMVTILSSMYANVRNYVRLRSNTSDFFDVSLGVKQGEPLSSILFISFVNDMHKQMSEKINAVRIVNEISSFMLMYADYTVLFANSESELQKMLDN